MYKKIIDRNNNKGFTLLELLMVVLVVGILASFAVPEYSTIMEKARKTEAFQGVSYITKAIYIEEMENSDFIDNLNFTGSDYLDEINMPNSNNQGDGFWHFEIYDANGFLGNGDYQIDAVRTPKSWPGNIEIINFIFDITDGSITGEQERNIDGNFVNKTGTCIGTTA